MADQPGRLGGHRRRDGGHHAADAHRGAQRRHCRHRIRPTAARHLDLGALGLDHDQISRLSRLWFDALAGICAHVAQGGGGLTPSDIAPARLSQQQIDELQQQYRIADVLPLTPLQQGLLFHASTAQGSGDDVYAVQLDLTVTGPLDPRRLREAVHTVVNRHPNLAARFCASSTNRYRSSRPIPHGLAVCRTTRKDDGEVDEQIQQLCAAERAAVCDLADPPAFRVALIRIAQTGTGLC